MTNPDSPVPATDTVKKNPSVRAGFTVAVLDNEEFLFKVHGTQPGIIELHGLVEFARRNIDMQFKELTSEPDIAKTLDKLVESVQSLQDQINKLRAS